MIEKETVLILGAGASHHVKYQLAGCLNKKISQIHKNPKSVYNFIVL